MSRSLTTEEIQTICSHCLFPQSFVHPKIHNSVQQQVWRSLEKQLQAIQIEPELISVLDQRIQQMFHRSIIQPGEAVGILAAQSIGEKQTQCTLNTFHQAGNSVATVITGVPRFHELINATRVPKQQVSFVYFAPWVTIDELMIRKRQWKQRRLVDFIESAEPIETCGLRVWWCSAFDATWILKIRPECCYEERLTLTELAQRIRIGFPEIEVACSSTQESLIALSDFPEGMLGFICSGLPTNPPITEVYVQKNPEGRFFLQIHGGSLSDWFGMPDVDYRRTTTNLMWDVYNVLGIEATQAFLLEEFTQVVASESDLHTCHLQLLIDVMLFSGTIISISRHGMAKLQAGPFTKASFEESLNHFLNAAAFGQKEETLGISSAIMCGKPGNSGTGAHQLKYDFTIPPIDPPEDVF